MARCANALALPLKDFEDALIAACAKREGAGCIVSRDKDFAASTAAQFCNAASSFWVAQAGAPLTYFAYLSKKALDIFLTMP